eukprot:SAG31_NODE_6310_length_2070_cov_3.516489_2_plen_108_part_00
MRVLARTPLLISHVLAMPHVIEGDLTPAEISELSRPGYVRRDDGGFFATMEKRGQVEARRELVKPNNVSKKLASPAASSMAWPVNQPRIVDHHGQGGGQYPGNVRLR